MNSKFLDWYTQALGSTFGLIACIFAYLNGYMFVYGNIERNFDYLSFNGVISSYLLLPLCVLTLLLSFLKSLSKEGFSFKNINLNYLNICIIFTTIIVGFMGAKLYFIIPAIFMLLNQFNLFNKNIISNKDDVDIAIDDLKDNKINSNENGILYKNGEVICEDIEILLTRREMARDLLSKNADNQFIMDVTGLTKEEIESLEK